MPYKSLRKKSKWPARFKFLAIIAAIAAPIGGGAYFFVSYEPSLSDQEYFQNAQTHYQKGDNRVAVIELKNAIKTNPNFKQARFLLGKIYLELEQGAAAEKELDRSSGFKTDPRELNRLLTQAKLLQGKPREALDTLISGTNESTRFSYQEYLLLAQAHFELAEWASAVDANNALLNQRPDASEPMISLARIAFIKGDIAIAKTHLKKLKGAAEKYWKAMWLKGDIARTENKLVIAKQHYKKAYELKPNAIEPRLYHAMIALGEKEYDEVGADAEVLLSINPRHPAGHYVQGQLHFVNKKLKEAQLSFEEAVRYIDYPPALRQLGITHYQLGNLVQAEEYLNKYTTIVPRDLEAKKLLSAIYVKQNKLSEAKNTLAAVASKSSLNAPLQRMMAGLEQATGEPAKATEILNSLLEQEPDSLETQLQLGQTLLKQGKPKAALKVLINSAETNQASTKVKLLLITAHLQLKQFDAALVIADEVKVLEPNNPRFSSIDGVIHLTSGDKEKALAAFQHAQDQYPGDVTSGHQLGLDAIRNKQYTEAKGHYNRILAHNENHLQSQIQLGLIEYAQQNADHAQTILEQAIRTHPENPIPKLVLARAHLVNGAPQKALNWLHQIPESAKQSPDYLRTLGQAYLLNKQPAQAGDLFASLNQQQPSAQGHWLEAKARYLQKDLIGSREALLRAQKFAPDNPRIEAALFEILISEAEIAIRNKDYANAEAALAQLKVHKNPLPYQLLSAKLDASKGRYAQAIKYYEKALTLKSDAIILAPLLRIMHVSGQADQVVLRAQAWLKDHPDDNQIRLQMATSQLASADTDEAVKSYETLLAKSPDNAIALNNLAYLYVDRDLDKASEYAEKAYKIAPKVTAIIDTYGWVMLKQGQHQKALKLLSKAHSKMPEDPSIRYHLASAQAKNDKRLAAIKSLRAITDQEFSEKTDADALLASLEWKPE